MASIDRKPHCLVREKTLAMPRHVIIFDTETEQIRKDNGEVEHRFTLGWCCYYRKAYGRHLASVEWFNFHNATAFWQFVFNHTGRKRKLWVIARSLVFDFTVVSGWKHLREAGYKLKFFHTQGTTTLFKVRKQNSSILFVDVLNWFRESLAVTGQRLGIPKLVIDFDTCSVEYLNTYCKRDVEIELANLLSFIKFLESNRISRLCYTIGSTAMAAYLFGHYDKHIYIHNNKEAIELERKSYKGGRVECFFIGDKNDGNYYVLDVNSLYPTVMRNNLYPVKYVQISQEITSDTLCQLLKDKSVIAEVLIDTDEPAYAVRRERTLFPIGRFSTVLTTPELKYALERGHIVKIGKCVIYKQANIFKTYVDKMYALRQKCKSIGLDTYTEICKLLLNSLYGKFGQKAEVWTKIGNAPDEPDRVELLFVIGERRTRQIRYLLGEIFELTGHGECFNSFPAISSHVTTYGRLYLWDLIKKVGIEHCFYCDTDSLIVNEVGLWRLHEYLHETDLGYLKVESTTKSLIIHGLKDYATDAKSVLKGIRKNAIEIRDGVYEQELWPSFKGTLRSGDANLYQTHTLTKALNREYTKGIVTTNGKVVPFVLDEPVLNVQ